MCREQSRVWRNVVDEGVDCLCVVRGLLWCRENGKQSSVLDYMKVGLRLDEHEWCNVCGGDGDGMDEEKGSSVVGRRRMEDVMR